MINVNSSSIVPFKHQINSFEWTSFFKDFTDIRFRTENQILVLEETKEGSLRFLEDFLSKLQFSFSITDDSKSLRLNKILFLPRITKDNFFHLLQQYYFFNTDDLVQEYRIFINTIIADLASHIRIISGLEHPLRVLIEGIKREVGFEEVRPIFESLLQQKGWSEYLSNTNEARSLKNVSINTWLHILRHPKKAKANLLNFLNYMSTNLINFPFIFTDIPLVEPLGEFIFSITAVEHINLDLEPDDPLYQVQNVIVSYWLTFGALVLRNLTYALIRFTNLSLEGFTHDDIGFYEYIKPKITQFSESTFNPDLVQAFKVYDNPKSRFNSAIRGNHELYTYNRSVILEYHLKQAQQEFERSPNKKILRKRVNRRSKKLFAFLNDVIFVFKDYLNEISNLTKASGNYTSLEKIIKNDRFLV